jgi:alpha-amylase
MNKGKRTYFNVLNRVLSSIILILWVIFFTTVSYVQAEPRTVFVHLFEWRWEDIAKECENFLGPKGYAAVQISPPNEHRIAPGFPWWERYQPVTYKLESRSGTREEFIDMVRRCDAVGVKIYADAVINHMTGDRFHPDPVFGTGSGGSHYDYYNYPIFQGHDFHDCRRDIQNYRNKWEVQNCNLVNLADLNTGFPEVQQKIADYLNDMVSVGVAGFRIDAAKHMDANDIHGIISQVNGNPLIFQEVIESAGEPVQGPEYFQNGLVTEFDYGLKVAEFFRNGRIASLRSFGDSWQELMQGDKAVVFIDNHDNQRGHGGGGGVITYKDGQLYDLANFFMLSWPYGYPKVMSSYDFHTTDEGPPGSNGNTKSVYEGNTANCFTEWKCEHRWRSIANMVAFRNNTSGAWTVDNWWDNGNNQIAYARGDKGFVVINRESFPLEMTFQTKMPPGTYCNTWDSDLKDGKCTGTAITVFNDGKAFFRVEPWRGAAIHVGFKPGGGGPVNKFKRTVVLIYGETFSGQDMFIRGGIDHEYANTQLNRSCSELNFDCAIAIRHNNLKNATTRPWKNGDAHLDWYGKENGQNELSHGILAQGTPLDWTIDKWPQDWGTKRTVLNDGFGEEPLNTFGPHYWMLDVDMDCSKTVDGWFEFKSYISNGPGWEGDINQPNTPYSSKNHFGKCGYVNVYKRNQGNPVKMSPLAQ